MTLATTWFLLVFVLLIGYAILDGFDLGVGVLHLFARGENERRISLNSIGPVWDGNEVWLLTGGGALFAAFPAVYATVFSGFYLALMLLLVALIGRAVAMEFRSKVDSARWKYVWDIVFFLGSMLPALLLGVAFGNILRGIPIDADQNFTGSFVGLLNPYAILVGLFGLVTFTLHGALYLALKTEGDFHERTIARLRRLYLLFIVALAFTGAATIAGAPSLLAGPAVNAISRMIYRLLAISMLASVILLWRYILVRRMGKAFIASSIAIASLMGLAAVGLFPRLVPSSTNADWSLTITNSSSTPRTLMVMLIIALIGMPLVVGYTFFIYRAFRGKVTLHDASY